MFVRLFGAKWLRNGIDDGRRSSMSESSQKSDEEGGTNHGPKFTPHGTEVGRRGANRGVNGNQNAGKGGIFGIGDQHYFNLTITQTTSKKVDV
ncbi:hypothetical protein ACET3Z_010583 [Daucus carota]